LTHRIEGESISVGAQAFIEDSSPQQMLERRLLEAVRGDSFWNDYLSGASRSSTNSSGLHLAVFVEPYLRYLLEGQKTVESRFSAHRIAPYQSANVGDVILLKRTGGPIVGLCRIAAVWFYRLDPSTWASIKGTFTEALCAQDPTFWHQRASASFASLMRVSDVRAIGPIHHPKRDRRGWVVLRPSTVSPALPL
jgi:hypothetical protein